MWPWSRKETEDPLRGRLEALITALETRGVSQPTPSPDREPSVSLERFRELEQVVKDLDADLDWLTAEVKKMRGKVTGGRKRDTHQMEEEPVVAPPRFSPEWWRLQRNHS